MRDEAYPQWVKEDWKFFSQIEDRELRKLYRKCEEDINSGDFKAAVCAWNLIYENLFRTNEDLLKEKREILSMKNIPRKERNELISKVRRIIPLYQELLRRFESHREELSRLANDQNYKEEA